MKHNNSFFLYLFLVLVPALFCSCSAEPVLDESDSPAGRPLQPGELSNVTFGGSVSSIEEITTRAIPTGKQSVLHDFTNHELEGKDGGSAGWISGEVRTQYDEDIKRAATRSFDASKQLFGKNSKFRMLVFVGPYGGTVDMSKPVANMVCQVNSAGNGASFVSPATTLGLLKGRYTFVCFPADEKYNTWQVGKTTGSQIPIGKDEDFVCMKYADININTSTTAIPLNQFTRYGYQLTVKFSVNGDLGYLLFPQKELELEISDGGTGTTNRVINTNATFDLQSKSLVNYNANTASFKDTLKISGSGMSQSFSSVSNFLIANDGASQKLTIKYPQLTVLKPAGTKGNAPNAEDSVFTIKGGTYTTSEDVQFESGKSYSITLAVGEQIKGILVIFRNSSGSEHKVIFARSQLYYNKTTGKYDIGKEQCDYGYVEAGIAPNTGDSKLVTTNAANYYFMYGCLDPFITANTGNGTNSESGGMSGYYSGSSDLNTIGRDPCSKYGKDWISPTRDMLYWMGYVGTNYYNGSSKSKPNTDFFPVDENGNRLNTSGNPYWGTYTPTDGRSNKTAVKGMWIGLSSAQAKSASNQAYNGCALFLPAAGFRYNGVTSMNNVGSYSYYWSSQQYNSSRGQYLFFYASFCYLNNSGRDYGFSVRCVLPE